MPNSLVDLIRQFAERLQSDEPVSLTGEPLYPYFQKRFADTEPVSRLEAGWIDLGGGAGRSGAGHTLFTIERFLQAGRTPEEIADQLIREIDRNAFGYLEVHAVDGIQVRQRMELDSGFYLIPNTELPVGIYSGVMFGRHGMPFHFPSERAALVFECEVSPAIRDGREEERDMTEITARMEYARLLRLAMGLATCVSVEINMKTEIVSQDTIFFDGSSGMSGSPSQRLMGQEHLFVNPAETLRLKTLISEMGSADAIQLAIDRLIKSRRHSNSEDRVIDLGMAAEIALMHQQQGSGDGKGEITNKISSRGACLLGQTAEERVRIFDEIRDLYSARSITVHTGRTPDSFRQRLRDWDKLVARIFVSLLERGSFPDWKRLVLS